MRVPSPATRAARVALALSAAAGEAGHGIDMSRPVEQMLGDDFMSVSVGAAAAGAAAFSVACGVEADEALARLAAECRQNARDAEGALESSAWRDAGLLFGQLAGDNVAMAGADPSPRGCWQAAVHAVRSLAEATGRDAGDVAASVSAAVEGDRLY